MVLNGVVDHFKFKVLRSLKSVYPNSAFNLLSPHQSEALLPAEWPQRKKQKQEAWSLFMDFPPADSGIQLLFPPPDWEASMRPAEDELLRTRNGSGARGI